MLNGLTAGELIAIIGTLIVSLVIHEFMHGYAGYLLGDTTARDEGRLSLNPLRHIDPFMTVILPIISLLTFGIPVLAAKPVPFNAERVRYDEFGAALIALAGPLSNLVLAFVGALIARGSQMGVGVTSVLGIFIVLNVAIFVFNMIPIPPLDGSRVLYAFAPAPLQDLMRFLEPYGLFVIFGLILLGGFSGLLGNIDQIIMNHLP